MASWFALTPLLPARGQGTYLLSLVEEAVEHLLGAQRGEDYKAGENANHVMRHGDAAKNHAAARPHFRNGIRDQYVQKPQGADRSQRHDRAYHRPGVGLEVLHLDAAEDD